MSQLQAQEQHKDIPAKETPEKETEFKYEIQGSPFRQTELTIAEDIQMIKLFKDDLKGDDAKTILDSIADLDTIEKLLRIILKGDHTAIKWNMIKNSELEKVMGDFFLLNKSMIQKFMSLGLFFQNPTLMNQESKS